MEDLQMFNSLVISSKVRGNYTVKFIDDLKRELSRFADCDDYVYIVDRHISNLFAAELSCIFQRCRFIVIDCKEENKTLEYSQALIRMLIDKNIRKNDQLIVIGGGIAQDISCFVASILFRGVNWIFYPTTLLAQCDSCIGSKSSINFDQIKNLLGTFNPPSEIYIYPGFLNTLKENEIKSGIGEMLHYFFSDGIDIAKDVSEKYDMLLTNRSLLPYFVQQSLKIKKRIIQIDEFDTSIRHIFNYGHTFGHAIEAITQYRIPHGQAISIGMDLANFISMSRGMINEDIFSEMHDILIKNMPVFKFDQDNIDRYIVALSKDKKNKGDLLGAILTSGPGKLSKVFLKMDESFKTVILQYSSKFLN